MKCIYASVRPEETRMGLVEAGRLQDYIVERHGSGNLVGNIYRGSVSNVVPGIQAAFVDLDLDRNGFLTLRGDEHLTQGQQILVQVVKDCRGNKGPGVTQNITLPGRYVVLEPFGSRISLSRKIAGRAVRTRLRELVQPHVPRGMGLVLRTAAGEAGDDEILADLEQLVRSWDIILRRSRVGRGPQLLHRELDLSIRMLRDYVTADVDRIVVDEETAEQIEMARTATSDEVRYGAAGIAILACILLFALYWRSKSGMLLCGILILVVAALFYGVSMMIDKTVTADGAGLVLSRQMLYIMISYGATEAMKVGTVIGGAMIVACPIFKLVFRSR